MSESLTTMLTDSDINTIKTCIDTLDKGRVLRLLSPRGKLALVLASNSAAHDPLGK